MKILKNDGKFEVLSKTDDVIWQIANSARTCYKSFGKQSPENDLKLVENLLNRGHYAMIEFADMTVKFTQVSRGVTHELVRHRLASFAQESTRYVNESDLHVVVPPHKNENENILGNTESVFQTFSLKTIFQFIQNGYKALIAVGFKPEDARQILPIATEAPICIKANLREWRQIFKMRCDKYAHWEIRAVMLKLLKQCQKDIPLIFDDYHFFKTENGQEYARPVTPINVLKDEIEHFISSKLNTDTFISESIKGEKIQTKDFEDINKLIELFKTIEPKVKEIIDES